MPLVDPVYTGIPLGAPTNTAGYTGTPLEKLSSNCPTLECHWTIAAYIGTSLEGRNSPHTRRHIELSRVAPIRVWNDKMAAHQATNWQVSVNSAFTWSLLLCNGYQFCSSNVWVLQHHSVHALDMSTTGTTLVDASTQWCPNGNPVLICIIGTHWKTTGATSTLGCHWNHTGWC